jgi:uncharacterized membrane protein YadS
VRSSSPPFRAALPGLAFAATLAAIAWAIARAVPPSPYFSEILFALLVGAAVANAPPIAARLGLGGERDRFAPGLAYTGRWVLRLGIVLMGLKVQTQLFGRTELLLIGLVSLAALPSAFFVAHALGTWLRVRRPLVDLLAGGTMICGASAVNAVAPVVEAEREEQGLAIGVVFVFSVFALIVFHPVASAIGLSSPLAGLWSGLAVNDLSSAIAVGAQMGATGGVMATASKSARILLLAPTLMAFSLARRHTTAALGSARASIVSTLPGFLVGYVALAVVRAIGDRAWGGAGAWHAFLAIDRVAVDACMLAVSAGIGLSLRVRPLLRSSPGALLVGGGTSVWMAMLTLAMIATASRGWIAAAALIGALGVVLAYAAYRAARGADGA